IMQDIWLQQELVNIDALDEILRANLGEVVAGVSTSRGQLVIHLSDAASLNQVAEAKRLFEEHDPSQLSKRQQIQAERQAALAELQQHGTGAINLEDFRNEAASIQHLAKRVALLELQLQELLGS